MLYRFCCTRVQTSHLTSYVAANKMQISDLAKYCVISCLPASGMYSVWNSVGGGQESVAHGQKCLLRGRKCFPNSFECRV